MNLLDAVEQWISGDWGMAEKSDDNPNLVYCIRGADIVPILENRYTDIPKRYISTRSTYGKLLRAGDIVIEKSGGSPIQSTGRVVYVTEELIEDRKRLVCSNFCEAFRCLSSLNKKFVFYYLQYVYSLGVFFNFEGKTSGLKNLNVRTAFSSVDLPRFSRHTQDQITEFLSSLDRKIALNRRKIATLEKMAKEIYDYWFVQYDFPDANGRPYKSSGGEMVYSPELKREIPKGWKVDALSSFCEVVNGATPSTSTMGNYGGNIVWITPKDLSDQGQKFIACGERCITKLGYESCSTHMIPKGSLLMSSRAPIGLLAMATCELCTNQGFKNLVPHDMSDRFYLYYYLQSHMSQIEQLGSGTTFKEVSREAISKYPILYVTDQMVRKRWVDFISPIFGRQMVMQDEVDRLIALRDFLLPLLMNGQARIGDAAE